MAEVLEAAGWDVTLAENLSIKEMLRTVRLFVDRAEGSRAVLFYYAGHGIEVKGQNYLLPVDATLSEEDNEDSLPLETIALSRILEDFHDTGIRLKTIVLDCCRDNPLTRSWLTTRRLAADGGLAEVPASALPEGTMLVFSTSPGSTAADGSGRNSPFTESFVRRARAGGGGIADVFADVASDLGERQPAWIRFDGSGVSFTAFRDYPLIPGKAPDGKMFVPRPKPTPPPSPILRVPEEFATVQAAIDAATEKRNVILIGEGIFVGSVTIAGTPGLEIRGTGQGRTILRPPSTTSELIDVTESEVNISNLTLEYPMGPKPRIRQTEYYGLLRVEGGTVSVSNCELQGGNRFVGMGAYPPSQLYASDCVIKNCHHGVIIYGTLSEGYLRGLDVQNCEVGIELPQYFFGEHRLGEWNREHQSERGVGLKNAGALIESSTNRIRPIMPGDFTQGWRAYRRVFM